MTTNRFERYWLAITIFLIAAIISGGTVLLSKQSGQSHPVEIMLPAPPEQLQQVDIYVGDAVVNPGFYPLQEDDSIEDLLQAAGGVTSDADLTKIKIYIPKAGEDTGLQLVNINRAEAWLLQALPGIGQTRAQAIIDYRNQNGPFHNIGELIKAEGIGPATYDNVKDLITVED